MISSILTGVFSSIAASYIFLYLYLKRKIPQVEISKYICREVDANGNTTYWFKYINKTDVPIYDVKADAYFLTPFGADGGQNIKIDDIVIKHSTYTHIPPETKTDKNALHCVQVRCTDDLDAKWNNQASFIRFEVIAKHEISGFSKVFVKDYHNRASSIKNGAFKFGNNLEIS
jgi:hypothetical protein